MSRTLDAGVVSALEDVVLYQALMVHLDFDGDPAYLWTGNGTVNWDGHDWLGTGDLGSVSAIQESSDGSATGVSFTLSGIDDDLVTKALTGDYQGRDFNVYVVLFYGATAQMIVAPQLICSGEMDQMHLTDGEDAGIVLTGETYAANDQQTNEVRYTAEAQELLFPGDKGFEFVPAMLDVNLLWGTPGADLPSGAPNATTELRSFNR